MGKDLDGKELGTGISQRKDNKKYIARYTTKYTSVRMTKCFDSLKEAQKWMAEMNYKNVHSSINDLNNISVDFLWDLWFEVKEKSIAHSTAYTYKNRYFTNISPVIGKMLVTEVKLVHCQMVLNRMEEDYSVKSIRLTRMVMENIFAYAVDNDIISNTPCRSSLSSNFGKEAKEIIALTIFEQKMFVNAIKNECYKNQFLLIMQTGLRISELIGLTWDCIDFENRKMYVKKQLLQHPNWHFDVPKTKNSVRSIPLTDEAIAILNNQKQNKCDIYNIQWNDLVFKSKNCKPIQASDYNERLYTIADKMKHKRFSVHVLRHTFATRCAEAGMQPKTLQMILGHSKITTTLNIYVHSDDEQKNKEMNSIQNALKII